MTEQDDPLGASPSEGTAGEPTIGPHRPSDDAPPPGEIAGSSPESPRDTRLRRAADYAARLVRRGATRRASSIRDEAERLARTSPPGGEAAPETVATPEEPPSVEEPESIPDEAPEPPEAGDEPAAETADAEEEIAAADELVTSTLVEQYLDRVIRDEEAKDEIKAVLAKDEIELLKDYLGHIGVPTENTGRVAQLVKATPVRIIMQSLKDLGLPESKADEAHEIIMTEKGELRAEHIVSLGFSDDDARAVQELLNSSHAHRLRTRLEKVGLSKDMVDQILSVGNDEDRLLEAELSALGVEDHVASRIVKLKQNDKFLELRKQELGYQDEDKMRTAHSLKIPKDALEAAQKRRLSVDILIAAVKDEDIGLKEWLANNGVELPSGISEGESKSLSRDEARKLRRELSKVPSLYPYPEGHPLYGLGYSNYPHMITRGETNYYQDRMKNSPAQLRNSLRRPGSLPLPDSLYYSRITRPILDVVNVLWCPIGKRRLAHRLYEFERLHHPEEDYGMLGRGLEKRREQREHVDLVDKTIIEDRSLLSWHRRHRDRGDIRRNPRLDLAQSIAETKRDMYAFEIGRPSLPDEKDIEKERLTSRETFDKIRQLPEDERNDEQKELLVKLAEEHPEWA